MLDFSFLAQATELFPGLAWNGEVAFWVFSVLIFAIFAPLAIHAWLHWRNEVFKHELKWVLLEIKVPRETDKSPKAMEQVLGVLHSMRNAPSDFGEKYWDGEITRWNTLEIVSFGGEVHMYIRCYYKQKDMIEAAFYSYYRDIELIEVDDYMDSKVPVTVREVYEQGFDMWGSELVLKRESAYPIKSYIDFESIEEERQVDPMSSLLELLAKVKKEEFIAVHILISPADFNWHEQWKDLVDKLTNKTPDVQRGPSTVVDFPGGPLPAFDVKPAGKDDPTSKYLKYLSRSPGETDVLKAVERNLSKNAFDTVIRFIYLSPKSMFYDSFPRRAVGGAFNQYSALDLNAFVRNEMMSTRTKMWYRPYVFPKTRNEYKKQRLLHLLRAREIPPKKMIGRILTSGLFNWNIHSRTFELTTESLATIFHPPTRFVLTAPHMVRVESRKTGPPAGLAIFGEEGDIERLTGS